ncbi:toxin TcdB middle/N-terminal domain-containing protein [Tessaracoccus oleiagri]|uniref:RHS repeat-associated core domain-containing protein n=1 Tax=Tessaracoccus oleiagri TaxID=686624 RepID=A0A1G9L1M5_9ACTN|nr:toxin TcdB middle/N-terminal domain-containing protein [Tessaracoccus oleiagri]SDL55829.1 RHS repeat-associated core domain-containing protein [Tessaracoccus oleiagri]
MEAGSGADATLFGASGGGALRPLGDAFEPDLLRGTGNYSVPLEVPPGPGGIRPTLGLRYSTGQGNGPYGMGWQLSGLLTIVRGTDGGVPRYDHTDTLLLGGDELVDVGDGRWRPRSDRQFWDIRRSGDSWVIRTKEGRSFTLGSTPDSRLEDGGRVFAWYCDEERDAVGNTVRYTYLRDGGQLYVASVQWGIFELRLVHGPRPDVCTTTRPGFPVTTALRCNRVERHCLRADPPLVGQWDLKYEDAPVSSLSLLTGVRYWGIGPEGERDPQPPLGFAYSRFDVAPDILRPASDDALLPLGEDDAALVDLTGDGLPDVLQTSPTGHRLWRNRGGGRFDPARKIPDAPAGLRLGRPGVTFADLTGDGTADLLQIGSRISRLARNDGAGGWLPEARDVGAQMSLVLSATDSRLVDLDGDGVTDMLQTGRHGYTIFLGDGEGTWTAPEYVRRREGDDFPSVRFGTEGTVVADFAGDGMPTIGEVRSGLVRYWPSLGRGRFGPSVEMANPPVFPRPFRGANLFTADLDGDGTTDLLYVDGDRILLWLNRCGTGWSDPVEIPFAPPPDVATLELVDLLGTGSPGLLWAGQGGGARFIDLGLAPKPYLLTRVDNGCGASTTIRYATTSQLRNGRGAAHLGDAWGSFQPFPLQVVEELEDADSITGAMARTRISYERGHFDPVERIFRGFESVEVWREGDDATPATIRRTAFHLGDTGGPAAAGVRDRTSRTRQHALAGSTLAVDLYALDGDRRVPVDSATFEWDVRDEASDASGVIVAFPHLVSAHSVEAALGGRDRLEDATYTYDEYGNLATKHRSLHFAGGGAEHITVQEIAYAVDEASWRVGLPSRITTRDEGGAILADERLQYDGEPFVGLPGGEVGAGLLTRRLELALVGAALPDGYADRIDPDWGLVRLGDDWYRTVEGFERDAFGNVTGQRDPGGATTRIEYDADGQFPVASTDALARRTSAKFDPRTAQPSEVVTPEGLRTRYVHTPTGRLVAQFDTTVDGGEALTAFHAVHPHDPANPDRPAESVVVLPHRAGFTVDQLREADPATLADAAVEFAFFDGRGTQLQRSAPAATAAGGWVLGGRARRTPDGRPAEEFPNEFAPSPGYRPVAPGGPSVRFHYDALGRVTLLQHPDGGRFRVDYLGDEVRKWDAETPDDAEPTIERFDASGALVAVETPLPDGGAVTRYDVDHAGRILAVTDAEGATTTRYRYAGPGPAVVISDPAAGTRTYWRDAAGRVRRREDSQGRVLETAYDAAGRERAVVDTSDPASPSVLRTSEYDGARLVAQQEGAILTRYTHDALGRRVGKTVVFGPGDELTLIHEYGFRGEVSATVQPDGFRVEQRYHRDGSPDAVTGIVDAVDYDEHGLPALVDHGGVVARYRHTREQKRLVSASLELGDVVLRGLEYGYDRNGLIVSVTDTVGGGAAPEVTGHRYSYDALLRLVRWTRHEGGPEAAESSRVDYSYNRRGDLLRSGETGPVIFGMGGPDARLLTAVTHVGGTDGLSIDASGRLTAAGGVAGVRYDAWDRIVEMRLTDGSRVRLEYDAKDRRQRRTVERSDGTVEVTRWVDGYEVGPGGSRTTISLGSLVVATRVVDGAGQESLAWVFADHLGSVLCTVDPAGTVLSQQSFTPFGLPRATGAEGRYAGGHQPEGGMVQLGSRWYHPMLGRFVTPDWYVLENPEVARRLPQALNLYSYAINNPVMLRDPSGKWFGLDDLIVAGVGFVVGFVTGVVVGIAEGRGFWDTMLLGLEAGLLGAAGAWLAYATAGLALGALGAVGLGVGSGVATGIAVTAAVFGGLNGVISGATQIYAWDSWTGWAAFASDSTWGIVGTSFGVLLHTVNLFYGGSRDYQFHLSRRQNRHVYDGGFGFSTFAFTQGNVISNLRGRHGSLLEHETAHILQNRIFGPVFTATYVGWLVVGAVVGFLIGVGLWIADDQSIGKSIEDMAYTNNPWESWAYHVGGSHSGGTLAWS